MRSIRILKGKNEGKVMKLHMDLVGIGKVIVIDENGKKWRYDSANVEILKTPAEMEREAKETAAKETAARIISERDSLWGMTFKKYGNGRTAIATPTEEFWADWKANREAIKSLGFWVEKGVTYKVYARVKFDVDFLDVNIDGNFSVDFPNEKPVKGSQESMRDDLEHGLFNSNAASDLRAETPDEYDRRRDFEEDGYGEY